MIAVKGMEMPESCDKCWFQDDDCRCLALRGMSTYDVRFGFRHSDCPLVEVKGEGEEC